MCNELTTFWNILNGNWMDLVVLLPRRISPKFNPVNTFLLFNAFFIYIVLLKVNSLRPFCSWFQVNILVQKEIVMTNLDEFEVSVWKWLWAIIFRFIEETILFFPVLFFIWIQLNFFSMLFSITFRRNISFRFWIIFLCLFFSLTHSHTHSHKHSYTNTITLSHSLTLSLSLSLSLSHTHTHTRPTSILWYSLLLFRSSVILYRYA